MSKVPTSSTNYIAPRLNEPYNPLDPSQWLYYPKTWTTTNITTSSQYNIESDNLYKILKRVIEDVSENLTISVNYNLTDKTLTLRIEHKALIIHIASTKVVNGDIESACKEVLETTVEDLLHLILADLI